MGDRKVGYDGALLVTLSVIMFSQDNALVNEQALIHLFEKKSNNFLLVKLISRQTEGSENSMGN